MRFTPGVESSGESAVNGPYVLSDRVEAITTRRHFLRTMAVARRVRPAGRVHGHSLVKPLDLDLDLDTTSSRLPTALVNDEISRCHVPTGHRPECPQRYDAVLGVEGRELRGPEALSGPARPPTTKFSPATAAII